MTHEIMTLRETRERMAHSQGSLAVLAQVNRHTIGRIELNQHIPRPSTKRRIAAALNLKPWQLRWPDRVA